MTTLKKISLESLDRNLLRFAPADCGKKIIRSIRRNGLLLPPVVFQAGDELLLADGFRRIAALEETGENACTCLVREVDNRKSSIQLAATLRYSETEPTAAEKALLLQRATTCGITDPRFFRSLGIPDSRTEQSILNLLLSLPRELLDTLHKTRITLKQLRNSVRLGDRLTVTLLQNRAAPLGLNANQIRRALETAADIKTAGRDPEPLLTRNDAGDNPAAATKLFFEQLDALRRPEFSKYENEFNQFRKDFPHIRLDHRNFDDARFDFTLSAGSMEELRIQLDTLEKNREVLKQLFTLPGPGSR